MKELSRSGYKKVITGGFTTGSVLWGILISLFRRAELISRIPLTRNYEAATRTIQRENPCPALLSSTIASLSLPFLLALPVLGQLPQTIELDEVGVGNVRGVRFDGSRPGDNFGFSVSGAGDVNGDGFEDLLITITAGLPAEIEIRFASQDDETTD